MAEDLAGRDYWDREWEGGRLTEPVDPDRGGLNNYDVRQFDEYFHQHFTEPAARPEPRLLEVGCARSAWLPYFHREFGFEVAGLDYSEIGCRQARRILDRASIDGDIVCGDLFSPPRRMLGSFDLVVSFGVVEHFDDTTEVLEAMARLLRPGGLLFVNIPNLVGILGPLQRLVHRETYELHVPLSREDLFRAHRGAGLEVLRSEYFLSWKLSVLRVDPDAPRWLRRTIARARSWATKSVWAVQSLLPGNWANRFTSPYVHSLARKP